MRFLRWLVRCKNLHEIINIRHCLLVMNCGRRLWTMHIPNVPDNIMMILMTMVVMGCGCKLWTFCTFSYENVQSSCNVPRSGQSHVEREVCAYLKCLQLLSECFPFSRLLNELTRPDPLLYCCRVLSCFYTLNLQLQMGWKVKKNIAHLGHSWSRFLCDHPEIEVTSYRHLIFLLNSSFPSSSPYYLP